MTLALAFRCTVQSPPAELAGATWKTSLGYMSRRAQLATNAVEAIRSDLLRDETELVIDDYGARPGVYRRTVSEVCRRASKDPKWCRLLFNIVRAYRPVTCLELGTCLGISGAYIAKALSLNDDGGWLWTLEGAAANQAVATQTFKRAGLDNVVSVLGRFDDTLVETLASMQSVDFAFIDGHHNEAATIRYFETIRPYLSNQNVLVFDDIAWSDGMKRAWYYVCCQTTGYDFGSMGIVVNAH